MKVVHPCRRPRHAAARGDRRPPEADGRDRRLPDPLAHHEASTPRTASPSSSSPLGYKGDVDQGLLPRTTTAATATSRSQLRTGAGRRRAAPAEAEDWTVHLLDTGLQTGTGGRVKRVGRSSSATRRSCSPTATASPTSTSARCSRFHRVARPARDGHGRAAARRASAASTLDGDRVAEFTEKPQIGEGWINGGFFVFEPGVLRLPRRRRRASSSASRSSGWPRTASSMAYRHDGFCSAWTPTASIELLERALGARARHRGRSG